MGYVLETVKSLAAAVNEFWPMVAREPVIADGQKTACCKSATPTAVFFSVYISMRMF